MNECHSFKYLRCAEYVLLFSQLTLASPFNLMKKESTFVSFNKARVSLPLTVSPPRKRPVIVNFLAGHREALNGRHCRAGSTVDVFTDDQMISHKCSSAPGIVTAQTGNTQKTAKRSLHCHHTDERATRDS